ncbi:hypothetical protein [Georgenia sp. SUBG003]|uniref:hypothetical protein n=1 Tax=Georgenia sp. SUBG003 TaxID=1497974 RepID=UPI0004D4FBD3|nr:hypothetical protein DA06_00790 [Georgenia sp. SUBG003]
MRFSLRGTAALLAELAADHPALAEEVGRRHGDLPALRLPFAGEGLAVPEGYTTAVTLDLRGPAEVEAVRRTLAEVDDIVLLALPALAEIVVETDAPHPAVWSTCATAGTRRTPRGSWTRRSSPSDRSRSASAPGGP